MPRLEPVGRVSDPAVLDLEPIIIPVVGYTADKIEVTTEIEFRPMATLGRDLEMALMLNGTDEITAQAAIEYLESCMTPRGRERWEEIKNSDTVYVQRETMGAVFRAVVEVYAGRPSTRRSGLPRTGPRPRTSQAASRSRTSASRP